MDVLFQNFRLACNDFLNGLYHHLKFLRGRGYCYNYCKGGNFCWKSGRCTSLPLLVSRIRKRRHRQLVHLNKVT